MTREQALIEFLREEQAKFENAACEELALSDGVVTSRMNRLDAKSSILKTIIACAERGDHLIGRDVDAPADYQRAEDRDE